MVGGQAVMEGVMMRHADKLALAVRRADGTIQVETWPWFSLTKAAWLRKPMIRGFPVLLETLVNGVKALNHSASLAAEDLDGPAAADGATGEKPVEGGLKPWHLALTLAVSIGLALGLFVVVPHLFSLGMQALGLGSDMDGILFHVWDGIFKLGIFLGYIVAISFVPDIRRVFQYHGAEHKMIWAHEKGQPLEPAYARAYSRLHPRCGTTFLLLVLSLSICMHTILVPQLLAIYTPDNSVLKHLYVVAGKFLMLAPISALAYEAIRLASRYDGSAFCRFLSGPGMCLQRLTTFEPDDSQLEVAAAALTAALAATPDAGAAGLEDGDGYFIDTPHKASVIPSAS
ncbi:DUF1385 domain-containing protein [Megalodesulfovibrio paquesii]